MTRQMSKPQKLAYLLFACLCLFAFSHDLQYSIQFQAIQDGTGKSVAEMVEAGSWVRRVSLLALAGVSAVTLIAGQRGFDIKKSLQRNRGYLLFLLLAFLSISWAEEPSLALRRSTEFFLMSISAFALAQLFDLTELIEFSCLASLGFIVVGVLAELSLHTFHPATYDYRFCGTLHPNHQAWQCGLLVLSSCALMLKDRCKHRFFYAGAGSVGFVCLLLTKSRTTLGATLVAFICLLQLSLPKRQYLKLLGFTSLLIVGAVSISFLWQSAVSDLFNSQLAGRGADSVTTLTGRLPLWSLALKFVAERPTLGYGFYSFWTPKHIEYFSERLNWDVPESHNGYIELLLSLGIVGLVTYLFMVGRACRRYFRLARHYSSGSMSFVVALFALFLLVMCCDVIALDINLVTLMVFVLVWKAGSVMDGRDLEEPYAFIGR